MDSVLLQALVDLAPDGILLVHPDGRIVFANGQAASLFGYPPDQLLGRTIEDLVPERFRGVHRAHETAYYARPVPRPMGTGLELFARRSDGAELPVEISLGAIPTEEGTYVTAIVRDMTERRLLEEERRHLMAQTELQRDRERIARDLHDGVMQSIYAVGLSLLDTRGIVAPRAPEALPALDEALQELRRVIEDIRSYVMGLPLERFDSDIAALLREVVDEVAADSAFEVHLDVAPGLPALADGQTQALYHVVHEALTNVRKHALASHADVSVSSDGAAIVLEVRDNGRGFDPDASREEQHMGLRNMRDRVQSLGGSFEVESSTGDGTVLRARLPRAG